MKNSEEHFHFRFFLRIVRVLLYFPNPSFKRTRIGQRPFENQWKILTAFPEARLEVFDGLRVLATVYMLAGWEKGVRAGKAP